MTILWEKVTLGDIAKIRYGKDHKKLSDGDVPVYGTGGIMRYADSSLYDKKSVLIPRKGSINNLYFVKEPFWTVDTLFYTEINESRVIPEFLYYKLKTYDLASMNVGSAVPSLTTAVLNSIELTLPPMSIQQKIVAILMSLDNKIDLNRKVNHHLMDSARSIYSNMIRTFETTCVKLKDIATITMGQSPKSNTYNNKSIGLPLLNGAADFRGKIQPSKWTSNPIKKVQSGEYIFGVRATIGLTTKVFDEYAIGRGTGSAKAKSDFLDEFLYFALEDLFDFFSNSGSGTVYVNISKTDFDNYEINIPSERKIIEFHENTKSLMDMFYNNKSANEYLSSFRDSLLPKLMSGELSIVD